jgi:hypothetical protein
MKKRSACIALALLLTGCAFGADQIWADFRNRNSAALINLKVGMTMDEVKAILGTQSMTACQQSGSYGICLSTETITNPAYTAALVGTDGKSYVAWMYYSSRCGGYRHGLDCHTPIVFQDGRVVGWGKEYLSSAKLDITLHEKK